MDKSSILFPIHPVSKWVHTFCSCPYNEGQWGVSFNGGWKASVLWADILKQYLKYTLIQGMHFEEIGYFQVIKKHGSISKWSLKDPL